MPQMNISNKALEVLKKLKEEKKKELGRTVTYSEIIENIKQK